MLRTYFLAEFVKAGMLATRRLSLGVEYPSCNPESMLQAT
jgi:hypothetical protein